MSGACFEQILAGHCAPVLMGRKAANLVAVSKEDEGALKRLLAHYGRILLSENIRMEVLCSCKTRYQILVYRPDLLQQYLMKGEAHRFLVAQGYPGNGSLKVYLEILKERYNKCQEFPHEIGLFLGYPLEDVIGFLHHGGKNFKLCRYWKVYGSPERAQEAFDTFDRCKEFVCEKLHDGYSIREILEMKQQCA